MLSPSNRGPRARALAVTSLALLLLAACSPRTHEAPPEGEPFTPTAVAQEMLELVNDARSSARTCGEQAQPAVPPLELEARLTAAAQGHSEDMFDNSFMGHGGSNGSNFIQRAERSGYRWTLLAENVAVGYTEPTAVMAGWLQSPGHCANIMMAGIIELGVGLEGTYWTQMFGAPAD